MKKSLIIQQDQKPLEVALLDEDGINLQEYDLSQAASNEELRARIAMQESANKMLRNPSTENIHVVEEEKSESDSMSHQQHLKVPNPFLANELSMSRNNSRKASAKASMAKSGSDVGATDPHVIQQILLSSEHKQHLMSE